VAELRRGSTVLHLHNPPDTLFPAALFARSLGRRVIFDHHDLFPELVEVRLGRGPWYRAAQACERATFALADHVLAANESHARIARERGGVPPERVTVVRNGPPRETIVPEVSLRPGALRNPHLVYVGTLASQDGGDLLPELLVRLSEDHGLADARLTVVGDGDERPRIEATLARLGLSERARITGWVSLAEVRELIASADICVDTAPPTSLNHQSTMIKIAEYMAAGKPIVAFGLVETMRTAETAASFAAPGDLGDMAAAVADLAANYDARLRLAKNGLTRVRSLVWERSADALLGVYARL
jgi:glycosyltransferase involved in cell wall biosynthesis